MSGTVDTGRHRALVMSGWRTTGNRWVIPGTSGRATGRRITINTQCDHGARSCAMADGHALIF